MKEEEQVFYGRRWSFEEDKFIQDFAIKPGVEFEDPNDHRRTYTCERITERRIYYSRSYFTDKSERLAEPGTRDIMDDLQRYEKAKKHLENLEKVKTDFGSWEDFKRFHESVKGKLEWRNRFTIGALSALYEEYEGEEPPAPVKKLLNSKTKDLAKLWKPLQELIGRCETRSSCDCDSPYIQLTEEAFRMVCDKMMRPYRKLKEERNGVPA